MLKSSMKMHRSASSRTVKQVDIMSDHQLYSIMVSGSVLQKFMTILDETHLDNDALMEFLFFLYRNHATAMKTFQDIIVDPSGKSHTSSIDSDCYTISTSNSRANSDTMPSQSTSPVAGNGSSTPKQPGSATPTTSHGSGHRGTDEGALIQPDTIGSIAAAAATPLHCGERYPNSLGQLPDGFHAHAVSFHPHQLRYGSSVRSPPGEAPPSSVHYTSAATSVTSPTGAIVNGLIPTAHRSDSGQFSPADAASTGSIGSSKSSSSGKKVTLQADGGICTPGQSSSGSSTPSLRKKADRPANQEELWKTYCY